jgi:P-type E1-E2 ATPase
MELSDLYYNGFMIELNVPGRGILQLEHLVLDVNGTLALDGRLLEGLTRSLLSLRDRLDLHLITADTHGRQNQIDRQLGLKAVIIQSGNEAAQKAEFVRSLGAEHVAAIGQGANDALMLREAALGIAILSQEGTSTAALLASDLVTADIFSALDLFNNPMRIVASLRA